MIKFKGLLRTAEVFCDITAGFLIDIVQVADVWYKIKFYKILCWTQWFELHGLVQERRNSSALGRLSLLTHGYAHDFGVLK